LYLVNKLKEQKSYCYVLLWGLLIT